MINPGQVYCCLYINNKIQNAEPINKYKIGDKVTVRFIREGKEKVLTITLVQV